ncbi:tyrosine-type recombinase/integrase [Chitinophaga sp. MM2321]|uniref:tyrosine-type recombinase/integrase n=1 Tax=Chitinophaga sp. MM2321 TaxID=3137178 RepID=UPI0032D5B033
MATVKVILKTHRKKDDGTFPLCIRISNEGKSRYKYIGFSVKTEQFKEGISDWIRRHPDALYINSIAEDERSKIMEKITRLRLDNRPFDFDFLLSDVPANGHTFSEILDKIANRYSADSALTLYSRMLSLKEQLRESFNGDVILNSITIEDVRKIDSFFRNEKKNTPNTVARKIRHLRSAFREAQRMWPEIGHNPFEMFRAKTTPVGRIKLLPEQITLMEELKLVGVMDLYRDAFLFSYYAQGMRFGSVVQLQRDQIENNILKYRMTKGLHFRELEIHPKLQRIIDKYKTGTGPYLFPVLKELCKTKVQIHYATNEANTVANTCLKRIAILIGITDKLTFHVAKHSFAQMIKRAKVDPWVIKDSLGHTNFSTTEAYLNSLDDDEINKAVTGLY